MTDNNSLKDLIFHQLKTVPVKATKAEHFEDLWQQCENAQNIENIDSYNVISALTMKLNLYTSLATKISTLDEETQKSKSRLLGEILFHITSLSLKENINVFEALETALQHHSIDILDQKYPL